jgi:hypothetical protein
MSMKTSTPNEYTKVDQNIHADGVHAADTSWLNLLGRWNMEIASLYGKRMQECSVFPFSLMMCTSPDDVTDAQERFSGILLADYRAAAEKLMHSIGTHRQSDGSEADQAYAATLLKAQDDARNILDQARAHAKRIIDDAQAQTAGPRDVTEKTKAA